MASDVEICNRALQKLGAKHITSLSEDSRNGRSCNLAYGPCRLAELRAHPWSFAVARATLAADADGPTWGKANSFTLPALWLRMVDDYFEDNSLTKDWEIEGKKIFTDDSAPLYIRYIYNVTDPQEMDALFREALACKLAWEMCEEITQSNAKKDSLESDYEKAIRQAKRINAIEKSSAQTPDSEWITCRR